MAKEKAKPANNLPVRKEHKFNIDSIAKVFNLEAATMRGKLRNADVATDGGSYGWDTQKEMDEAVAKVKASSSKNAKPKVKAAGTGKARKNEAVPKAKVKKAA